MAQLNLSEILKSTNGRADHVVVDTFRDVGTDSRESLKGQLFIALAGDRFDAHDFLNQAVTSGAKGLLIHRWTKDCDVLKDRATIIQVADTLKALQALGSFWREKNKFTVVGITGSNGKTTTKEFAKALIGPSRRCHASEGSFNNHWGVPISLLKAAPDTEVVIQEMGMNHRGELTELCKIARPNVVLCTMVGRAHIGELGSQAAVAEAKEEIYQASPEAKKIFNLDNEFTRAMFDRAGGSGKGHLTFSSFSDKADVILRAEKMNDFRLQVVGRILGVEGRAIVPVVGRHNVVNLMAAAAAALAVGVGSSEIWARLPDCRGAWGRNQLVRLENGAQVLFDAYNANPESMAAMVKNLFEIEVPGKKILVLGEMKELGSESSSAHRELGEMVARSGFDVIWFMGSHAADFEAGMKAEKFSKTYFISNSYEESLAREVGSMINPSDIAVIKGSRAMKMEQVLQQWRPVDFAD